MFSLQNYTTYSILSGFGTPEDWLERADELGYDAIGISEKQSLASVIKFQKECEDYDIQPIVGEEFLVTEDLELRDNDKKENIAGTLLLYAKTKEGLKNLIYLNNFSNNRDKGFYYRPRIDVETLKENSDGLICVSPSEHGYGRDYDGRNYKLKNQKGLYSVYTIFEDDFYLGINPLNPDHQNSNISVLAFDEINRVFTFDAHYPKKEHGNLNSDKYHFEDFYDVMRAIEGGGNPDCMQRDVKDGYMPSFMEVRKIVDREHTDISSCFQECLSNLEDIKEKCEGATFETGNYKMPKPHTDKSVEKDLLDYIADGFQRKICNDYEPKDDYESIDEFVESVEEQGLEDNKPSKHLNRGEDPEGLEPVSRYLDRLEYEYSTIKELGYLDYFHIVHEICDYIDNDYEGQRGPSRGSAGGALFSQLVDIIKVDPIRHGLIFERFLNPDRQDLPDIDIDFSTDSREEAKRYSKEQWGEDRFCSIITYDRFKVKSGIKSVARAKDYAIPDNDGNLVNYSIGKLDGMLTDTNAKATAEGEEELELRRESSDEFDDFCDKHSDWIDNVVLPIQGNISSKGIHASGYLITRHPLNECVPLNFEREHGKVCQWEYEMAEEAGHPKFDFLSVKAANILDYAKDLIDRRYDIDIPTFEDIPLNDKKALQVFHNVDTEGIFQFKSYPQQEFGKKAKISRFGEVSLALAIVRPGPMAEDFHIDWARTKNGHLEVSYPHEDLEDILGDTLGFIVYQEQIMKIVQKIGGLTRAEADYVRKACGKKRREEMKKWEEVFKEGGKENGYDESILDSLWDTIVEFSEYGFNRCLTGDTLLYRAGRNHHQDQEISIKELYNAKFEKSNRDDNGNTWGPYARKIRQGRMRVLQLKEDGRVRPGYVKGIYKNGEKPVFELTLEDSTSVKCTKNHRWLTVDGYKRLDELSVGDELLVKGEAAYGSKVDKKTDVPQHRGHGESYSGEGFRSGKENVGYHDGRSIYLKEARSKVFKRANGHCEECGKEEMEESRFEFAHLKSLEHFDYDYERYNSKNNIKYLCNSCHKKLDYKKGERVSAWSKGKPTKTVKVSGIEFSGFEMTYDLEMKNVHNFLANGIVSHNSHATGYALMAYYQAYLKSRFPLEFWCAALEYASDEKGKETAQDLKYHVKKSGVGIVYPNIYSFAPKFEPVENEDKINWPVTAISRIGEKTAESICKDGRRSYDSIDEMIEEVDSRTVHKGIFEQLIKARFFDPLGEPWEAAKLYFQKRKEIQDYKDSVPPELTHQNNFRWYRERNKAFDMIVEPWKDVADFHENVQKFPRDRLDKVPDGKKVFVGGYVRYMTHSKTKYGDWYLKLFMEDDGEEFNVMCWPGFVESHKNILNNLWQGQLVEMIGEKDSYKGYSQVTLGSPKNYFRIVASEFDEEIEDVA